MEFRTHVSFYLALRRGICILCMEQVYHGKKQMSHITYLDSQYGPRVIAPPGRARPLRVWPALVATLLLWGERRRTRLHLSQLDDRLLADVDLTRAQQRSECVKSFWQP
jgi:uncharacterized protein YjiS (DUF1127 family)